MRAKLLLSFASFVLATFLAFLFFEFNPALVSRLNLNLIHYFALKERYRTDDTLIFRMKPNYRFQGPFRGDAGHLSLKHSTAMPLYQAFFDEEGFRNGKFSEKPEAAVLGDSYIQFGLNDEDTFTRRFEKITGLKTLNYGMEWYGPFQYIDVFKRFIVPKHPDYVFFCFFEGNDLRDMREYQKWKDGGDYYHFDLTDKNLFQRYLLAMRDTFVFFGKRLIRNWDSRKVILNLKDHSIETVFVYGTDSRTAAQLLESSEMRSLASLLSEFRHISAANQITPVFVFIPSKRHIYQPFQANAMSDADLENVEASVFQTVKNSELPWISLTPAYKAAAKNGKFLYYENDTHWNSDGREIAARHVWHEFKRLNLLREKTL